MYQYHILGQEKPYRIKPMKEMIKEEVVYAYPMLQCTRHYFNVLYK